MKPKHLCFLFALLVGLFVLVTPQAWSQSELVVQWTDGLNIIPDALYNAYVGDTINRPADRVYRLLRGGYYQNTKTITNTGRPLRIVGTPGSPASPDSFPPIIQMIRVGSTAVVRMFSVQNDLTLKDVWITGSDEVGTQSSYQPIQVDGSGYRIIVDHCYFDRSSFAIIAFQGGAHNVIYYTNNHFRNLLERPITQKYTGRAVSIWADQDTVIFENNTVFIAAFCAFQMESGAIKYLRFNHNTLVNIGRNVFVGGWWRTARFANNLFINPWWEGEDASDLSASGRDGRAYNSGFWGIGPLPSSYGPEQGRSILFTHSAAYRDPQFQTGALYGDTIHSQPFVNRVTKEDYLDKFPDNDKISDTSWIARPGPNFTYPDSLIPKMWASINALRAGSATVPTYFYELASIPGYGEQYTMPKWPLPERFDYATPANLLTAGTDGLPLGDLNWFPTQKATFLGNYQAYAIDGLEALAPKPPTFAVDSSLEAEKGTLSGGATVNTFGGFAYFQMDAGGSFEWNFNVTNPGDRNLYVYTNMRNQDTRGQHHYFNTHEVHDSAWGWGELIFSNKATGPNTDNLPNPNAGVSITDWAWYHWNVTDIKTAERQWLNLPAGANNLKVTCSWGYQNFAEYWLIGATDTIKLKAADATAFSVVQPKGTGAPWVPSFFKSVTMGTNGTVTWTVNPKSAGNYSVQLYYQNYGTTQTATIKWDGVTVGTVQLPAKSDSTGLNVLAYPPAFAATTGSHTLSVTTSGVNLDYVILQKVVTGVGAENGLPGSFALEQNYPNPFNPTTTINYSLPKAANAQLIVYNLLGQRVATLVNEQQAAGNHVVQFDAKNLATGVYFYRLEAGSYVACKKMLLLK
jgi:predicted secreted protein